MAFDYGGRQELVEAARAIATRTPTPSTPTPSDRHLYAPELPPVDLMIRTSGEGRISNFLLWEGVGAQLYVTPTLWPDFGAAELDAAIAWWRGASTRLTHRLESAHRVRRRGCPLAHRRAVSVAGMRVLRVGGFALLLAGQAISESGNWIAVIAIWGFASFEFDVGAGDLALLFVVLSVPGALLGPLLGVPIDRLGPRRTLLIANVLGMVDALALTQADSYTTIILLALPLGSDRGDGDRVARRHPSAPRARRRSWSRRTRCSAARRTSRSCSARSRPRR